VKMSFAINGIAVGVKMIEVKTPFRKRFIVKNPKKIKWWKTLAVKNPSIRIKELGG